MFVLRRIASCLAAQRYIIPHVQSHWLMLRVGLTRRSPAEVWGQLVRVLFGEFGSAAGVVPTGNTGGTNISMFKQLPIAVDTQNTERKLIHLNELR
jgi:hypothetical protein